MLESSYECNKKDLFWSYLEMSRASQPHFNFLMLRTKWMNCHFSLCIRSTPSTMLRTSLSVDISNHMNVVNGKIA